MHSTRGGMPLVSPLPQSRVFLLPHSLLYWTSNFNYCCRLKVVTLPIGTNNFYDLRSIQTGSGTRIVCYVRVNLRLLPFAMWHRVLCNRSTKDLAEGCFPVVNVTQDGFNTGDRLVPLYQNTRCRLLVGSSSLTSTPSAIGPCDVLRL